jgi:tripartite-type tricarboxylate transporter receptor subunit TctC
MPDPVPDTFTGLFAPAGTPKEIVDKLNSNTVKILAMPDVRQQLANLGSEPISSTPAAFEARLKAELAFWGKAMDDVRIEKQ